MRFELSRRAEADLDDIRDFSVERFGRERTIAYLDAIEVTFRRIVSFPGIGAVHADLDGGVRSLSVGEHRVFYVHDASRALVVRVLHKRMDVERHL